MSSANRTALLYPFNFFYFLIWLLLLWLTILLLNRSGESGTAIQHSFGSPGHSNQGRKRNKRNPDWKRSKTLTVWRWHDPNIYKILSKNVSGSVVPNSLWPHRLQLTRFLFYGIFQPRRREWFDISFSRGSSWPRNWTSVSCTGGRFSTNWANREAQ